MFSRSLLDFSVGVGAFVIGLNQISSFFSYYDVQETSLLAKDLYHRFENCGSP